MTLVIDRRDRIFLSGDTIEIVDYIMIYCFENDLLYGCYNFCYNAVSNKDHAFDW